MESINTQVQCDHYDALLDEEWMNRFDYCYDCGKPLGDKEEVA
jgi:hypothetical protein